MKETRKEKVWMIIGVITLLIFGIGATFAYFIAEGGNAEQTNINVTTHTTDSLVFEVGKPISIHADFTNFKEGMPNQADETVARATLKANSSTNEATRNYYIYLDITTNEFKYTTTAKTAELILTVIDPNDNPVTSINGLNYVTVGDVSGFDVTELNGLQELVSNYEIHSTGTKIDEWDIKLTLINLDSDQNANTGKTFNATLKIQQNAGNSESETLTNHIIGLYTTQGANNLYHHDGTITDSEGNILDAEDGSYRYAGGDYTIAPAYQETYKRISKKALADTDALISRMCGTTEVLPTATCNEEVQYFYLTYEESEVKTQYATYKEALAKTIEDGYLLEDQIKNYVCFGSDEETCPYDNLYRIIGVFNGKVKLIKADFASKTLLGSDGDAFVPNDTETETSLSKLYRGRLDGTIDTFYWNKINKDLAYSETQKHNVWSYSELNKTNLNTNFINNLGNEWSEKIATSTYYVSGGLVTNAKKAYDREVGKDKQTTFEPYSAKIGLMYINDYMYATTPDAWKTSGAAAFQSFRDNNWLNIGINEWTISRTSILMGSAFVVTVAGDVDSGSAYTRARAVRPSFSLKSSVVFDGGSGSATDPYRIK